MRIQGRKFNLKPHKILLKIFINMILKLEALMRGSPKFSFPQDRKVISKENEPLSPQFHKFIVFISPKYGGYNFSMDNLKRFYG